jgi:hypothetical protein
MFCAKALCGFAQLAYLKNEIGNLLAQPGIFHGQLILGLELGQNRKPAAFWADDV